MANRDHEGYTIKVEPNKKKSDDGAFIAGVVWCVVILALLGWLFG